MEERPLYDFALALESISQSYATNLELRIDENIKKQSVKNTVELIQRENIIEEFRNYYNRHKLSRSKLVPASFATSHIDSR